MPPWPDTNALVGFFSLPKNANLWSLLNAPLTVVLVAAVIARLLITRFQEALTHSTLFRSVSEEPHLPSPAPVAAPPLHDADLAHGSDAHPTEAHGGHGGLHTAEAIAAAAAVGAFAIANFPKAVRLIDELKKHINKRAARAPDGGARRKYASFPRYDYVPLLKVMHDDGHLDPGLGSRLIEMFENWRHHRTGKLPVSDEMLDKLTQLHKDVTAKR